MNAPSTSNIRFVREFLDSVDLGHLADIFIEVGIYSRKRLRIYHTFDGMRHKTRKVLFVWDL